MTNVAFNISVTNDDIREESESFMLSINDSLPSRVSRGNLSEVTVTILDTTGELLTIKLSIVLISRNQHLHFAMKLNKAIFYG